MAAKSKSKEKPRAPRLEVPEEATFAERVELVQKYLEERYAGESIEALKARIAGLARDLKEVETNLATDTEGLEDALQADMAELDAAVANDPNAKIDAKRFNQERERLARQLVKREHLKRLLTEATVAHGDT